MNREHVEICHVQVTGKCNRKKNESRHFLTCPPPEKTIPQVLSITHSGTGRGKLTIPR